MEHGASAISTSAVGRARSASGRPGGRHWASRCRTRHPGAAGSTESRGAAAKADQLRDCRCITSGLQVRRWGGRYAFCNLPPAKSLRGGAWQSLNKVQLTPHARLAQPPRSLTPGCSLWMAGDHWTLRWKLFLMAAKQQHLAAARRRAGARAACHAHASVCAKARRGPRPRSGRRLVVELTDHRYLAGPPGPTAELGAR